MSGAEGTSAAAARLMSASSAPRACRLLLCAVHAWGEAAAHRVLRVCAVYTGRVLIYIARVCVLAAAYEYAASRVNPLCTRTHAHDPGWRQAEASEPQG